MCRGCERGLSGASRSARFAGAAVSALRVLTAAGSVTQGPVPDTMSQLTNLYQFYLMENQLSGPLPAFAGHLPLLSSVWLDHNNFSGPLPPQWCLGSVCPPPSHSAHHLSRRSPAGPGLHRCRVSDPRTLERAKLPFESPAATARPPASGSADRAAAGCIACPRPGGRPPWLSADAGWWHSPVGRFGGRNLCIGVRGVVVVVCVCVWGGGGGIPWNATSTTHIRVNLHASASISTIHVGVLLQFARQR
jgi:hypothetical protein